VINGATWRAVLTVSVCLAISALYELVEWRTSVMSGSAADAFLGTQGDVWDTQLDMFFALVGSVTALALLGRLHDRQLRNGIIVDS
jgi:putative membrane protein